MEYKQKISEVECGWAVVQTYERCLLLVCFVLVLFDGTWGQCEMQASVMVGMRRLTNKVSARLRLCNI